MTRARLGGISEKWPHSGFAGAELKSGTTQAARYQVQKCCRTLDNNKRLMFMSQPVTANVFNIQAGS